MAGLAHQNGFSQAKDMAKPYTHQRRKSVTKYDPTADPCF
jgi:hypothetical protein